MTDIPASAAHHLIIQNWGNRLNFQQSYGLKMTPEDIEEGNLILRGLLEETKQQEEERKKKENMRVLRIAMKVHREGLAERRRSQEEAEMEGEDGESRTFKKEIREKLKKDSKGKCREQVIIEEDEDEDAHSNSDAENDTSFDNGKEDRSNNSHKF